MISGTRMPFFPSPPVAPDRPESEPEEDLLDESGRLVSWEFRMCLELAFDVEQSTALVHTPHFTWHDADNLLKRGCSHAFVVDELT